MAPLTFGCPHLAGSVFLKLHSTDIKDNLFTNKRIQLVHLDIGRLTLCVKRYLAVLTGNKTLVSRLPLRCDSSSGLCEILIAETTWSCGIRAI